ncbi:GntR family transcriptional regulator [Actinophytocola oryzae]|uniref:DNA-binding GntR family transcriptional regulator n=1 Tax=Actinophytocola oryzae TaxID=502181 RepID=A0A4R7W3P6_9PSEU|nr:GntR family transcriptional regulator [Actinophytocola oryzae]TDV56569.1 DNA-binding GntR family transcriptional regulator [Actinophytocola oryzae]
MARPPHLALPSFARWTSVREEVTAVLRGAIVSGEMRPGELYSASSLAEQFGISATPVREAMLDLVKQGLVEVVRNRGFKVTEISEADLDHITRIRQLLEPTAAAEAVPHVAADELAALRGLASAIVDAAAEGNLVSYINADREFHLRLLRAGGNHRLVGIVDDLRAQTRLYGLSALVASGRLVDSAQEHVEMCDLIAAGDARKLRKLMDTHLGHTRREWAGREAE